MIKLERKIKNLLRFFFDMQTHKFYGGNLEISPKRLQTRWNFNSLLSTEINDREFGVFMFLSWNLIRESLSQKLMTVFSYFHNVSYRNNKEINNNLVFPLSILMIDFISS